MIQPNSNEPLNIRVSTSTGTSVPVFFSSMELTMKKYAMILAILVLAAGCAPQTEAEKEARRKDKIERAQKKIDNLYNQLHACDKNDGISDIDYGKYSATIKCKDGMKKEFNNL
jgi:hypothetical protein